MLAFLCPLMTVRLAALFIALVAAVDAQNIPSGPPSSPQDYPDKPSGDFSPAWQQYFQVTASLPNVTFSLPRQWAGNIPVQRPGHPNNTLFFWGFEKENGSLTAAAGERTSEPWGIWLNGGPGSSSLLGLLFENGPIRINNDYSASPNNYSWDLLADFFWIDQPVGTGFSTADADGYVPDEDVMGQDFLGFLANLVKVFPSLATRPLYVTGESYCGVYIPYITKTYFETPNPPVELAGIAIGNGVIVSAAVFSEVPVVSVLETYPQIIEYDVEVFQYFKEQAHLCRLDINLTYPQGGPIPGLHFSGLPVSRDPRHTVLSKSSFMSSMTSLYHAHPSNALTKRDRLEKRDEWKRDLRGRANGTIDPTYGCDLYTEMIDYAINYTFPWSLGPLSFDVYDIPSALDPQAPMDASVFLNDQGTRAALHAPTNKDWVESILYPFRAPNGDPSVEPMAFLTELATNATAHNMPIIIYNGNDDSLVPHRGNEVAIQNTTFGGLQGFTRKPATPWTDDTGKFAGIVHQERGWTYVLFDATGHLVPSGQPAAAFTFLREFVLGRNQTGLVNETSSGTVSVYGGEDPTLARGDFYPGQPGIYYGAGSTQYTRTWPSETVAAWNSYIVGTFTTPSAGSRTSGSRRGKDVGISAWSIVYVVWLSVCLLL